MQVSPSLQEQMLIQGQVDSVAVFTATSYIKSGLAEARSRQGFRWMYIPTWFLIFYSNGVMVSPSSPGNTPRRSRSVRAIRVTEGKPLRIPMRQLSCWRPKSRDSRRH